jgi:hypothetical protein
MARHRGETRTNVGSIRPQCENFKMVHRDIAPVKRRSMVVIMYHLMNPDNVPNKGTR